MDDAAEVVVHPGDTGEVNEAAAGVEGQVVRVAGGRGRPDRWSAVSSHASAEEGGVRLGRGEWQQLVLDHVQRRPDEVSPAQLSKMLGHSAGAISNVLVKLAIGGEVVQTSDHPRHFSARPR